VFSEASAQGDPETVGICLQAYLRSTPEDLESLLSASPTVRFVKGAYAEPAELAFPDRRDVDEAFFRLGVRVLESTGRAAFATHDSTLVRRLQEWVAGHSIERSRYEYQMLYGIRAEEQLGLARAGEPIRVLVSYGPAWFPWYMRRLAERPANVWFVLKNLFR
jgi:proline dehydrogenase